MKAWPAMGNSDSGTSFPNRRREPQAEEAETVVGPPIPESRWRQGLDALGGWLRRVWSWIATVALTVWSAPKRFVVALWRTLVKRRWVFSGVVVLATAVALGFWFWPNINEGSTRSTRSATARQLKKARRLWAKKKRRRSLVYYARAAKAAPAQFKRNDVRRLVRSLGYIGRSTKLAERALLRLDDDKVIKPLRKLFRSKRSRYRRRRAGEVLQKMGHKVDLVPLWIATLGSESCAARRLAVKRLGNTGDRRAIEPLRELSEDGWIFSRPCGAEEARVAVTSLRKQLTN